MKDIFSSSLCGIFCLLCLATSALGQPPPLSIGIAGNNPVCKGSQVTLTAPNGSIFTYTNVASVNPTFTQAGIYTLSVAGAFCAPEPIQITSLALPPAPNSILGVDTICLNGAYEFTATAALPGSVFEWSITGGSITGPISGKTITAVFAGSGPYTVKVRRVLTQSPYCAGPWLTKTLYTPSIQLALTGSHIVCPNSVGPYSSGYVGGETYEWSINNAAYGSIDINQNNNINVTWNNQSTSVTAILTVKVTRCGTVKTDTFHVLIQPVPTLTLTAQDSVCRGQSMTATLGIVTLTGGSLAWSPDGLTGPATVALPGSQTNTYTFNDISSGNLGKDIIVTLTNPNGCLGTYTYTKHVIVKPAPIALVTPIGPIGVCGPVSQVLTATLQSGAGATQALNWSTGANCSGPPFACNPITALAVGNYFVTAIGNNGCNSNSNTVTIYDNCNTGNCTLSPTPTFPVTTLNDCGHTTVTVGYGGSNYYSGPTFGIPPTATNVVTTAGAPGGAAASVVADFPAAGIYNFSFGFGYTCTNGIVTPQQVNVPVTIPLVAGLFYDLKCTNGTGYTVKLIDHSSYLPTSVPLEYSFAIDAGAFSAYSTVSSTAYLALSSGTTHTLHIKVKTVYQGVTYICTADRSVYVPTLPMASFTAGPTPACVEQQAITLTNTSTGGATYYWDFMDASSNTLPGFSPNPLIKTYGNVYSNLPIVLTVSNGLGCSSTASQMISTKPKNLQGSLTPLSASICENATALLQYQPAFGFAIPDTFAWHNDIPLLTTTMAPTNFLNVGTSGNYWAHVSNSIGCWWNTKPKSVVKVTHVPDAIISGSPLQCVGNSFTLYGYAGPTPGITYAWTRNGGAAGTTPNLVQSGLIAGTYTYVLTITVNGCSKTSLPFIVTVNPPPPSPAISFAVLNCNPYELELTASPNNPGTYNWSNGATGNPISTFVGGPYKVWYTDLNGCVVSATKDVPKDPAGYLWIFPTGCYTICPPVAVPNPIIPFSYWDDHLIPPGVVLSGTNSIPATFYPNVNGYYGMTLDNGYCKVTTDTMDITIDCHGAPLDTCEGLSGQMSIEYDGTCHVYPYFYLNNATGGPRPYTITSNIGTVTPPNNTGTLPVGISGISTHWTPPTGFYSGPVTFYVTVSLPNGSICGLTLTIDVKCPSGGPVQKPSAVENLADNSTNIMLTAAPNPAHNAAVISYRYATEQQTGIRLMEVYDVTGKRLVVHETNAEQAGTWTLNLDGYAAGLYQIVMREGGAMVKTLRLTVTR